MLPLTVQFKTIAPIVLIASAGLASACALAQELNQPHVIPDAKLSDCVNRVGQDMARDRIAKVPFAIKIASVSAASNLQARIVRDPDTAACIDLLAQNLTRAPAMKVPFLIRTEPER